MKMTWIATVLTILVSASFPLLAETFQYEAGVFHIASEEDSGDKVTLTFLGGRYFVKEVDSKDNPWNEAGFLAHASYAQAVLGTVKLESTTASADGPMYMLEYNHVMDGSLVTFGLNYTNNSADFDNSSSTVEETRLGFTVGKYIQANSRLMFTYKSGTVAITGQPDRDLNTYIFSYKSFFKQQNSAAINLEASLEMEQFDNGLIDGSNTEIEIAGDYYMNQKVSFGLGVSSNSGDKLEDEGTKFSLRTHVFFSTNIYGQLRYSAFSADNDPLDDKDEFEVAIMVRF